jgi:hypothetical protein
MNIPNFIKDINTDLINKILSNIDAELSAEEKADIFCLEISKLLDINKEYNYYWDLSKDFFDESINESLPRQHSVDQLKKIAKLSKKTDIGNRISDMNKQGANIDYIRNPIKNGIESYEDFERSNKRFISSWNTMNFISPFRKIKNKNKK